MNASADLRPLWLAGHPEPGEGVLEVFDKYDGERIALVARAGPTQIESALRAADAARRPVAALPAWRRREVLAHCARRIEEQAEALATTLVAETGKTIREARIEVGRAADTFRIASEEATRVHGEVANLETSPRTTGWRGIWKRVPAGVAALVTPFNFPLNLVAHKVAPAIAAGCPFVLKPASATPLSALAIGEMLAEADLPPGAFSVLPAPGHEAERLATDPRVAVLSFTGSATVGWSLRARAVARRVCLELGGNAACIVCADADLDEAAARLVFGAFYQAGQSCISVQRVLVEASVHDALRERLVARTRALRLGDPRDERTDVGPMIALHEAERIERWVGGAVARGARLLCGGRRDGALYEPTWLEHVPHDEPLWCEEAFGPVACLEPFDSFERALALVNDGVWGLQAGLFTKDLERVIRAWDELEVGGVIAGDVPSFRADAMPYGGMRRSGVGREGVRFAVEEMTEIRLLALRPLR
ncbi:MAG: aldehyde dehydrogenase family protein [Myxococcota bacterium]|nr:aldehyde dehydrogenase family protein [Myxococcota bacterium]MDW8361917.1 aldehyde dehydrogenase family protein [Myxococcales bacterium]